MVEPRKLTTLSHKEKRELCRHKQQNPGLSNRQLRSWVEEKFAAKVHEATIGRVIKKSFALLSNITGDDVKRAKNPHSPTVEEALYRWFLTAQEGRMTISDGLLMEKAKQLNGHLRSKGTNGKECKFSSGWLQGFKRRHNIALRLLHGETNFTQLTDETWDQFAALKGTLSDYEACDVFNLDETGFFYKLQPNRTLRDRAVKGQKKDKTRITVGLCANMDASIKLAPLVINKSKMPRAFSQRRIKRPNNLGVYWYANGQAWMKGDVFQDWLVKFEHHMKALGRTKVALLVDNAPGHLFAPIANQLKVTKVIFLPANTTARFQPMDAGIIRSFKVHYRSLFIRKQLADVEKSEPFNMDIYHAVTMTVQAWMDGVTADTIRNCWRHCDLVPHKDDRPSRGPKELYLEGPLVDPDLESSIENLTDYLGKLSLHLPVNLSVAEYIDADSVQNAPTFSVDADITDFLPDDAIERECEETVGNNYALAIFEEDGDSHENDESPEDLQDADKEPHMAYGVAMAYFESLKLFFQRQDYDTTAMTVELTKMMTRCTKEHLKNLGQVNLVQFFQPEEDIPMRDMPSSPKVLEVSSHYHTTVEEAMQQQQSPAILAIELHPSLGPDRDRV